MRCLFDNDNSDNYTVLDFSVIRHNQFLSGQDKFPDFDLIELSFDRYSHPHRILQVKEVVLLNPTYERVIIIYVVLDRNGELTVQPKDGRYKGLELYSLL